MLGLLRMVIAPQLGQDDQQRSFMRHICITYLQDLTCCAIFMVYNHRWTVS